MRMTKGLLAVAATALALMGFASSAMAAEDGVVRDVSTNGIIPAGRVLHAVGWAQFTGSVGTAKCHVTSNIEATGSAGTNGKVTNFSIPNVANCTWSGLLAGCSLSSSSSNTGTTEWGVTATKTPDFDVTGNMVITQDITGAFCPIAGATDKITASAMTLSPLKAGTSAVTGTAGHLNAGVTAGLNEAIAGVELSGNATLDAPSGENAVTISGELEITEADRGTWKIAGS